MSNECGATHPSGNWRCERPAFHPGPHKSYEGDGADTTWERTNREDGSTR